LPYLKGILLQETKENKDKKVSELFSCLYLNFNREDNILEMPPISQDKSYGNDGVLKSILECIFDHQDDIPQNTASITID